MKNNSGPVVWITFIGLILILIGIYGGARTATNFVFFNKYPTSGVLSINFSGMMVPAYGPREEDCMFMVVSQPYPMDSSSNMPSVNDQKNSCLQGVKEAREQAKINDISQSLLFLFLGVGILASRKYLFS